jgi:hypothetical protein
VTIAVSEHAVPAHLAHDDTLGVCPKGVEEQESVTPQALFCSGTFDDLEAVAAADLPTDRLQSCECSPRFLVEPYE